MKTDKEELEEYKLVIGWPPNIFEPTVNELIKEGWKLWGTPYVMANQHCQAMVKYKKNYDSYPV